MKYEPRSTLYAVLAFAVLVVADYSAGTHWLFAQTTVQSRPIPSAYKYQGLNDASGSYTAIAAVAGQKIQIWNLLATTGASTTMEFKSGSTTLTSAMTINGIFQGGGPWGRTAGDMSAPLFETAAGQAFVIVTGIPTQVSGQITYTMSP